MGTIWNLLKGAVGLFWKLPGRLGGMTDHDQDAGPTLGSSKGSPPGHKKFLGRCEPCLRSKHCVNTAHTCFKMMAFLVCLVGDLCPYLA